MKEKIIIEGPNYVVRATIETELVEFDAWGASPGLDLVGGMGDRLIESLNDNPRLTAARGE